MNTNNEKNLPAIDETHEAAASGKKAIEADKMINENQKPAEEIEKEAKDDAERWRNEG